VSFKAFFFHSVILHQETTADLFFIKQVRSMLAGQLQETAMSDKVVNFADRLKQRQAESSTAKAPPKVTPALPKAAKATFMRDLMKHMNGGNLLPTEDPSSSLITLAGLVESALDSMQAPQNSSKTVELMAETNKYSDEALFEYLNEGSANDMQVRPHFYRALVATARERGHARERDRAPQK
jgi:hypothetical protein